MINGDGLKRVGRIDLHRKDVDFLVGWLVGKKVTDDAYLTQYLL